MWVFQYTATLSQFIKNIQYTKQIEFDKESQNSNLMNLI